MTINVIADQDPRLGFDLHSDGSTLCRGQWTLLESAFVLTWASPVGKATTVEVVEEWTTAPDLRELTI